MEWQDSKGNQQGKNIRNLQEAIDWAKQIGNVKTQWIDAMDIVDFLQSLDNGGDKWERIYKDIKEGGE